MPPGANQPQTTIPLQDAIKKLSKYFGLYTVRDLAGRIALSQIMGGESNSNNSNGQNDNNSFDLPQPPAHITRIIELLIDTSSGGYTSNDIVNGINRMLSDSNSGGDSGGSSGDVTEAVNRAVKIVFGPGDDSGNQSPAQDAGVLKGSNNRSVDSIQNILGSTSINANLAQPNRDTAPSLSAIMMNSVRVLPIHKNINAVTIFMNSLPTIEISRCVPYLEVLFQFSRPPVDGNNQILGPGLIKFLDGAEVAADGTRRLLLNANQLSGSQINGTNTEYTLAGMEIFTAPQTLVNANEDERQSVGGTNRRSAPILDKFRPFMTFKSLTVEVVPSTGFMCYKTARMDFVLHDKTRIAEIADFIRPDLYSNTEILLEYGWSHPDPPSAGNAYADLLNGMRCREKYGIVNVSMGFDDAGQVNITLSLAMRGANDFRTETISGDESGTGDIIRQVRSLSTQVGELRRRLFQNNSPGTREVRGMQILDAAGDANGQLLLTPDLRRELTNFAAALRTSHNPSAQGLLSALNTLYGSNGSQGQVATLRSTIQQNIARKLQRISRGGVEAFSAAPTANYPEGRSAGRRYITYSDRATQSDINQADQELTRMGVRPSVTLGSLIMAFVGQPLAMSHKFDDIQLIFYPFNSYAAFARTLNIANFQVDTRYFLREYTRYRMESASRAADMSLQDFLNFIAHTIVEDPAAPSYGLRSPSGNGRAFWRTPSDAAAGGGSGTAETTAQDSLALQTRIEGLLSGPNGTPDGSFRLPQLDYYIECIPRTRDAIPEGQSTEGATALSILRVHIFDRNTTSYDTQAALLEANRDEELRSIRPVPAGTGGNPGVRESHAEVASSMIEAARNAQLITQIPDSSPAIYRINGGPSRLREFMMKTSPYIIVGAQGTAVKNAGLSTQQNAQLSTVNLLRSFHSDPLQPNGESPGGLPLQVIPCDLSVACLGCPLLEYGTKFFVDFGTGTTIDNYYFVTGLSHKFEQGAFTTDVRFSPYDGWGRYRSLIDTIRNAQTVLNDIQNNANQAPGGQSQGSQGSTH
jgi:hypothetical protein